MNQLKNKRAPKRTQRQTSAKAGWSKGRESYDHGTPIVVGERESRSHGEGAAPESGPEPSLDKGRQGRCHRESLMEGREMRDTNTILGLIRERGRKGLPLERVYRLLYNPELYLTAYGKIYRNAGAMTPGATEETVDGMSQAKIATIIKALRDGVYRWTPVRRTYIPKKNGKMRPLGMPTWSDKLVQEVVRMILEAYYEPQFSDHSHGFRPERGCHTALQEIYHNWVGTTWFIEGDISQCFDHAS